MSLINDALKKAQRQRTGDHPQSTPPMPGGSAAPTRPLRAGKSSNPPLLLIGAGAVIGIVIAGGTLFFFRGKPPAPEPTAAVAAPAMKPAEVAAAPAAANAPAATLPHPAESVPVVKTESAVIAPVPHAVSTEPSAVAGNPAPPPAVASVPAAPATPSLRMIEAIEALRVAGIRVGAGSDAKVLMNDRVFRLGDIVDHSLGIKLAGVTANSLTFSDTTGAIYTRNF